MKEVIKMLKDIEKDLARVLKMICKESPKAPVLKLVKSKPGITKIDKIRAMLAKGKNPADIADKIGVSIQYVYGVKSKDKKAAS